MAEKAQRIINIINQIAPPRLAESWDNVGLLVGDYAADVEKVLVALDVTDAVLAEAIQHGVQLIITHHPMIFKEIKTIRADQPTGRLILDTIRHGINIFAAHTNLDIANGGINDLLAERFGLTEVKPLSVTSKETLYKLIVYVPGGYEEDVRSAICDAGAGWIGNYSHCTFQTFGTGTYKPLEGTHPFIGHPGELEKVKEVRLETIIPASRLSKVVKAMFKVHPYEEVAYDLYPLANEGTELGIGRIGYFPETITYREAIARVKTALDLPYLHFAGDLERPIKKVALCSGTGASYIQKAAFQGADLYITGDVRFHDAQLAESLNLALIDAGHYWTEVIAVQYLYDVLSSARSNESMSFELMQSTIKTDPMSLYK